MLAGHASNLPPRTTENLEWFCGRDPQVLSTCVTNRACVEVLKCMTLDVTCSQLNVPAISYPFPADTSGNYHLAVYQIYFCSFQV